MVARLIEAYPDGAVQSDPRVRTVLVHPDAFFSQRTAVEELPHPLLRVWEDCNQLPSGSCDCVARQAPLLCAAPKLAREHATQARCVLRRAAEGSSAFVSRIPCGDR